MKVLLNYLVKEWKEIDSKLDHLICTSAIKDRVKDNYDEKFDRMHSYRQLVFKIVHSLGMTERFCEKLDDEGDVEWVYDELIDIFKECDKNKVVSK